MSGNTFGTIFKLTTFGESHGPCIGGIIDGCPSNIKIDKSIIQHDLDRRKPGQSKIVTQRKEDWTKKTNSTLLQIDFSSIVAPNLAAGDGGIREITVRGFLNFGPVLEPRWLKNTKQ